MTSFEVNAEFRRRSAREFFQRYNPYYPLHAVGDLQEYIEELPSLITRFMLNKIVLDNIPEISNDMQVIRYAEQVLTAFKSLKPTRYPEAAVTNPLEDDLPGAFSEEYGDRHGLVQHYSKQLRGHMDSWMTSRFLWNAPYTSLVNSSMMGKSRFQKQLALHDPVIYFCLRRQDSTSGYPAPTLRWVWRFLANPFKLTRRYTGASVSTEQHEFIEQKGVTGHLHFFAAVLRQLLQFIVDREWKDKKDKRVALWYLLGEPARSPDGVGDMAKEASTFWGKVLRDVRKVDIEVATSKQATGDMQITSTALISELCDSHVDSEQLILLIFDEARILTLFNCDGQKPAKSVSRLSRFRLLRRSLREMGKANIRIFSILTDTSSRLTNFQPKVDDDPSTRKDNKEPRCGHLFAPLAVMPTVDLAAKDLPATCDPSEVQKISRLMLFGRVAWSVMHKTRSADDMLGLAIKKLMAINSTNLDMHLYAAAATTLKYADRKFLACLGPRLALQLGSYTQDARELIASHMMCLEHVGDDHVQLFSRYLSEPILAEASARATGDNGWVKPLDYLLYKLLHGVVEGGFRGEFVTKALMCVAAEDAQRAKLVRGARQLADTQIRLRTTTRSTTDGLWTYSTPIMVRDFLNSLLRRPGRPDKRKHSHHDETVKLETDGRSDDTVPLADSAFVDEFLLPSLKPSEDTKHVSGPEKLKQITRLLDSTIFFNHWIRTDEVVRPSLLVKAWNRNAAIMCQTGATGIDFVIPIMMSRSNLTVDASNLGKCTSSTWTEDQQAAASNVISYLLIRSKNRKASTNPERVDDMIDVVPIDRDLGKHPNFVDHEPKNFYLSVLLDFRVKPVRRESAEMLWTRATLEARHKTALEKVAAVKKSERAAGKELATSEPLAKAEQAAKILGKRVKIAERQIPLVSFGLDGSSFKCLETRPHLTAKLNELLTATVDPLMVLEGPVRAELLEGRVCVFGEGEEGEGEVD